MQEDARSLRQIYDSFGLASTFDRLDAKYRKMAGTRAAGKRAA